MKKLLLLIVTALVAISADARNLANENGPDYSTTTKGSYYLYKSGETPQNPSSGAQAVVGGTLYKYGMTFVQITEDDAKTATNEFTSNFTDQSTQQSWINDDNISTIDGWGAPEGTVWKLANGHYYQLVSGWAQKTYNNGENKNVYYVASESDLPATGDQNDEYLVGGTYWYVDSNNQWVEYVPVIPTSWDSTTGTLTMGNQETRTIEQVMSALNIDKDDVQKIVGPNYEYDATTHELSTSVTDTAGRNAIKTNLQNAGFEVDSVITQVGKYVSILEDGTVVLNTHDETGVVSENIASGKLTPAEQNAIRNATYLKVEGTITEADWTGLKGSAGSASGQNNQSGLTHLDLSDAKGMTQNMKLENYFKTINFIDLPTDPNYTSVPESFASNSSLHAITFPPQITSIGKEAFKGCPYLQTVHIDSNIKRIDDAAFMGCNSLVLVEFDNGITDLTFGKSIFEECKQMKHCILPEGLTTIGEDMFQNCHMLESVRLPNTLISIPNGSFENCASMTTLVIPIGVQTIGQSAFNNSGIHDLYLTQTDPCDLPTIVPLSGDGGTSTFGIYALNGNNTLLQVADGEAIANMTSDEAAEYFRSVVLGGNNIIELHYPTQYSTTSGQGIDPMTQFLDGNPWYQDEELQDALTNNDKAGAAEIIYGPGKTWRGEFGDGDNWKPVVEGILASPTISGFYAYVDKQGLHWPSHNMFEEEIRNRLGLMSNSELNSAALGLVNSCSSGENDTDGSKLAWRQFVWMHGYAPHEEIYQNEYDDTWYTICFPFDCSDEQLEAAFNSNFNIAEFSGVAVEIDQKEATADYTPVDRLLFLFTNIAETYYMMNYEGTDYYFERKKVPTQSTIGTISAVVDEKWYHPAKMVKDEHGHETLVRIQPGDAAWPPFWPETGNTLEEEGSTGWVNKTWLYDDDNNCSVTLKVAYNKIDGKLARAFHPYMLHPQHVETPAGGRSTCYIPNIEYKIPFYNRQGEVLAAKLAENRAQYESDANTVTRRLSTIPENPTEEIDNADYIDLNTGTIYLEPYQGGTMKYKFQGTPAPNEKDESGKVTSGDRIPDGAYFLAVKNGQKYPKYYRRDTSKQNAGYGYWMQFTAIIQPNAEAKAWEDSHNEIQVNNDANGFSLALGEFEEVTADEIEEIINEAKAENKPVRQFNVVVNVNGQIVREGTSLVGLPRGLYIVNGKKYMVR